MLWQEFIETPSQKLPIIIFQEISQIYTAGNFRSKKSSTSMLKMQWKDKAHRQIHRCLKICNSSKIC